MSTRSIILITDDQAAFRLYKHCDGYPTENLPLIASALDDALLLDDVNAASVVRVLTDDTGARQEWEGSVIGEEAWGDQGDLEWIYHVDLAARNVAVYGGGYTGDWPGLIVSRGTVQPLGYVEHIRDEYQDREAVRIGEGVAAIHAHGWTLNGESTS